ncbi:MAG: ATP-binding cassette domain-containing protein [Candidatus Sulfobium sp.]|jgi:ABC-2 type transport system ATP-binding protein
MIEVAGLTKNYGEIRALHNVSFSIADGEVFGLLGPNGAGKTTTIKILTTLSNPDAGRCVIDGYDISGSPHEIRKRIGVVPQENNLDRELSAYENLLIYGMLHSVKERGRRIREVLETVGLWERRDSVVQHFSGGMQRRLILARALLPEPSALFLDEPSVGLDPQIRRHIWDVIRKIRKDRRTVVITTHYIEEAEALCDRVGILSKGRVIALDAPGRLKEQVGDYVVEFVDEDGRLVQHVCRSRAEADEKARSIEKAVTIRQANLEDVFIKLTGERIE